MISGSFTTVAVLIMKITTALAVTGIISHGVYYYGEYQPTSKKSKKTDKAIGDSPSAELRRRVRQE